MSVASLSSQTLFFRSPFFGECAGPLRYADIGAAGSSCSFFMLAVTVLPNGQMPSPLLSLHPFPSIDIITWCKAVPTNKPQKKKQSHPGFSILDGMVVVVEEGVRKLKDSLSGCSLRVLAPLLLFQSTLPPLIVGCFSPCHLPFPFPDLLYIHIKSPPPFPANSRVFLTSATQNHNMQLKNYRIAPSWLLLVLHLLLHHYYYYYLLL